MFQDEKINTKPSLRMGQYLKQLGSLWPCLQLISYYFPILLSLPGTATLIPLLVYIVNAVLHRYQQHKTPQQRCQNGSYQENTPTYTSKQHRIRIKTLTTWLQMVYASQLLLSIIVAYSYPYLYDLTQGTKHLIDTSIISIRIIALALSVLMGLGFYNYQRHQQKMKSLAFGVKHYWPSIRIGQLINHKARFLDNKYHNIRQFSHDIHLWIPCFSIIMTLTLISLGQPISMALLGHYWLFTSMHTIPPLQMLISIVISLMTTSYFTRYKCMSSDYLCIKVAAIARSSWMRAMQDFGPETEAEAHYRNDLEEAAGKTTVIYL